jgi:hypothetical protein
VTITNRVTLPIEPTYTAFVAYGDTNNPASFTVVHRIVQVSR